ncbi:MAG: ferredoxin [Desulfovibrio sp.]|nr:ferredoxin [Desulfovibrio sp.]
MERPIIEIDEELCNGCGQCILDCAEGALAIVNGKARLISDVYCDGLGACLNCPQGALRLRTREAAPFDEAAAMQAKAQRELAPKKTLEPLLPRKVVERIGQNAELEKKLRRELKSHLRTWPIQLELMPPAADYLEGADLLLAAQCAGFALPGISQDWIAGRVPIIACPKLENNEKLIQRLANIIKTSKPKSITTLRMSVPCCNLERIVREAIGLCGVDVPWQTHVVQPG